LRILESVKSDDRSRSEFDPALEPAYEPPVRRPVALAIWGALAGALIVSGTFVGLAQVRSRQRPTSITMSSGGTDPSPTPSVVPTDVLVPPVQPEDIPARNSSPPPTSAPVECHNSTDKRCGDFYWMTQPGSNAPLRVSIVISTPYPTAGQPVTFVVTASDPDAPNIHAWGTPSWGDHTSPVVGFALCITPAYGGWSPPPKRSGTEQFTFTHTYAEPGSYTFRIGAQSDSGAPWQTRCLVADPYESVEHASKTVTVGAASTESPSPRPTASPTPTPTPTGS
jgi:hypothetical protein